MLPILASFCNVKPPYSAALGVLEPEVGQFRVVLELPQVDPRCDGICGLTLSDDHLFISSRPFHHIEGEAGISSILIFRRSDLRFEGRYRLNGLADVHSIYYRDGTLYVVSTGTDEVVAFRADGGRLRPDRFVWRPDNGSPYTDVNHLNAVTGWREELLVSGFGPKPGPLWSSAIDGFIFNVTRGEYLARGIEHPHSVATVLGKVLVCESRHQRLRVVGQPRSKALEGYARGLCVDGNRLYVATSIGRKVSKSTGRIDNSADPGQDAGTCAIHRLNAQTLEIEATFEIGTHGREVYDLLPIDTVGHWPPAPDSTWTRSHGQPI